MQHGLEVRGPCVRGQWRAVRISAVIQLPTAARFLLQAAGLGQVAPLFRSLEGWFNVNVDPTYVAPADILKVGRDSSHVRQPRTAAEDL